MLDTGVRVSHVEFAGRVDTGYTPACPTGSETNCGSNWMVGGAIDASCHGHGTHCAGTVAGTNVGVAKQASCRARRARLYLPHAHHVAPDSRLSSCR